MPPERITKTMTLPPEPHVEPSTSKKPAAPTYLRFSVTLTHHTADDRRATLYVPRLLHKGDWVKVGGLRFQIALIEQAATNRLQMGDLAIA